MTLPATLASRSYRGGDGAIGAYDLLSAHVIRDALVAAEHGSLTALAWLTDGSKPFGGRYWAESLGAGQQVADALDRL
jgi:hypothetical protein